MAQPNSWDRRISRSAYLDHLRSQQVAKKEVGAILKEAADEAEQMVLRLMGDERVGASVRRAQLNTVIDELRNQQEAIWRGVTTSTRQQMRNASLAASQANEYLAEFLSRSLASTELQDQFRLAARSSAENVRAKFLNDVDLSPAVYRNQQRLIDQVNRQVSRGLAQNRSAKEIAQGVRGFITPTTPGGVNYAAMRLARTEINNSFHAVNVRNYDRSPFVEAVKWELSASHPRPDECDEYADDDHEGIGQGVFSPLNVPFKPHPQCLIAGTRVSGPRAHAATARWWTGQICEIEFADGSLLSITPNHPVLTTEGWVPAGLVNETTRVVRGSIGQGDASRGPDPQKSEALIEDVAAPLLEPVGVSPRTVPTSSHDFHGDGLDNEVAVVGTDGYLMSDVMTAIPEPFSERFFGDADVELPLFSGLGSPTLGLPGLADSTGGVPGSLEVLSVLLGGSPFMNDLLSLSEISDPNSSTNKHSSDWGAGDTEEVAQFLEGSSGLVFIDEPVEVRRRPWSGHVYNLQTEGGWYIGNTVVVHNCLCYTTTVTPSRDRFTRDLLSGQYDSWLRSEGFAAIA